MKVFIIIMGIIGVVGLISAILETKGNKSKRLSYENFLLEDPTEKRIASACAASAIAKSDLSMARLLKDGALIVMPTEEAGLKTGNISGMIAISSKAFHSSTDPKYETYDYALNCTLKNAVENDGVLINKIKKYNMVESHTYVVSHGSTQKNILHDAAVGAVIAGGAGAIVGAIHGNSRAPQNKTDSYAAHVGWKLGIGIKGIDNMYLSEDIIKQFGYPLPKEECTEINGMVKVNCKYLDSTCKDSARKVEKIIGYLHRVIRTLGAQQ